MALSNVFSWLRGSKRQHSDLASSRKRPFYGTRRPIRLELELLEKREVPATAIWNAAGGGFMSTPGNWVGGVAPSAGDDLVFPALAQNITVTNDFSPGTQFKSISTIGGASVAPFTQYTFN